MRLFPLTLHAVASLACCAQICCAQMQMEAMSAASSDDKLGTVSFSTSCAPAVQAGINRGVALLHDFWYEEAQHQFDQVAKADPSCAIAHWGSAMSSFHQIWSRPNETARAHGWAEIQQAQALTATPREKAYIDALAEFFRPGPAEFPARVQAYSDAMGKLYAAYPDDIDAGAFYALSPPRPTRTPASPTIARPWPCSRHSLPSTLTTRASITTSFTPATTPRWLPWPSTHPTTTAP